MRLGLLDPKLCAESFLFLVAYYCYVMLLTCCLITLFNNSLDCGLLRQGIKDNCYIVETHIFDSYFCLFYFPPFYRTKIVIWSAPLFTFLFYRLSVTCVLLYLPCMMTNWRFTLFGIFNCRLNFLNLHLEEFSVLQEWFLLGLMQIIFLSSVYMFFNQKTKQILN